MNEVETVRSASLGDVPHGFLGRRGGVSEGAVWGLNAGLGSDDDPANVSRNRRLAAAAVHPNARLVTAYQVHSARAVPVSHPWPDADRPHADALVTDRPGLLLGVVTADCAPVLLADATAGVVAAAHAGWRGAFDGVIDSTVELMERLGASLRSIAAAVGPCIAQQSYEVDEPFKHRFLQADPENSRFFVYGTAGKPHFDLQSYVVHRLIASGVGQVEAVRMDTYTQEDRFFSYRRASHRGEPDYGRQLSLIALR